MSHIRVVELSHDASGSLGLSIAGGVGSSLGDTPIMVANLTSGGPAERSRKLKVRNSWAIIKSYTLSLTIKTTRSLKSEWMFSLLSFYDKS